MRPALPEGAAAEKADLVLAIRVEHRGSTDEVAR